MNRNPLINTMKYEVYYLDGFVEEMTVDQIAENMLLQVKYEGDDLLLIKDISDQYKDTSVINKTNGFLNRKLGKFHANKTTIEWTLQV